jgi:hypothetical protein
MIRYPRYRGAFLEVQQDTVLPLQHYMNGCKSEAIQSFEDQ